MTEVQWDRNARCLKHFRQHMNKIVKEYEYINTEAPTKIHKATDEETEYYMGILKKRKTRYFNPLVN